MHGSPGGLMRVKKQARYGGAARLRRAGSAAAGLAAVLLAAACGEEGAAPPPPVSYIVISPADTLVALSDSLRLTATAFGLDGAPLARRFHWAGEPADVATVDSTGLVVALASGDYRVTAREPEGVRGFARVRVRRLTGFAPEHGAFGQVVTFRGVGLGANSTVRFGPGVSEVKSVSPDGRSLDAWVHWDAATGPVELGFADGTTATSERPFYVTGGGDDALEPNALTVATPIPIPFRNPYLLTRRQNMDHVAFQLTEERSVTIRVMDRQLPIAWPLHLVVQLNEPQLDDIVAVSPAYAYWADRPRDGLISRARLKPGRYSVRVFVYPSFAAIDRRYEIVVDTGSVFERTPDRFEPNDFPGEAPLVPVPFDEALTIENPWMADYFRIHLPEASRVVVQTDGGIDGWLALFFFNGPRSVHHIVAAGDFPPFYAASLFPFSLFQEVECVVDAGEYAVGVIENVGLPVDYRLRITAEPAGSAPRTCRQPGRATSVPHSSAVSVR